MLLNTNNDERVSIRIGDGDLFLHCHKVSLGYFIAGIFRFRQIK